MLFVSLCARSLSHFKAAQRRGLTGSKREEGLFGVTIIIWPASYSWARLLPVLPQDECLNACLCVALTLPHSHITKSCPDTSKKVELLSLHPLEREAVRQSGGVWLSGCCVSTGQEVPGVEDNKGRGTGGLRGGETKLPGTFCCHCPSLAFSEYKG